ncbi:MAG TPA: hypothetical protein VFZ97_01620 [Acidimicrobiales bacterium]
MRPGSGGVAASTGGVMGSGVRAPSFSGGLVGGLGGISNADDDVVMPGRSLNPSSGLAGIGRMSGAQGDNLARLAPTAAEQPTVPLRKRKPADSPAPEAEAPAGKGGPAAPPQASQQAPRPQVAVEPWMPSYDDILPQRASSGKSFRFRRR